MWAKDMRVSRSSCHFFLQRLAEEHAASSKFAMQEAADAASAAAASAAAQQEALQEQLSATEAVLESTRAVSYLCACCAD